MFDRKTRILIVDDMMTMRKMAMKILNDIGFTDITEATNGRNAWEMISAAEPAFGLIISEWSLLETSGIELLKRVRAEARFSKTPFILVSAQAEAKQIEEAVKAGVSSYVVKPFNAKVLKEKIEAVYKKASGT